MKDKKAAKKIIRLAKEHPDWYTKEDVLYAKDVKRSIKRAKKAAKGELTHEQQRTED